MYLLKYTDTGKSYKTISRKDVGAGRELLFTVVDSASGSPVDLTGMTTSIKLNIGIEGTLQVTNATPTAVTASAGTLKYALATGDFSSETTGVGTFRVEIECADNATYSAATIVIRASGASLTVLDTIGD